MLGNEMRSHAEVYARSLFSDEDLVEHAEDMAIAKWNKRVGDSPNPEACYD